MNRLQTVLEMIKFEHTVFALPFAFLGALLAAGGLPDAATSFWILTAMAGARSAAMAFNRLADQRFDALNPRTAGRALPAGKLTRAFVAAFVAAATAVFIFACWRLNGLALKLSPVALAIVFFYSYTKRFTPLSHLFLGLSLAVAPMGGWVAVRGSLDWPPVFVAAAVAFWVGGFDVIYACQDLDFDRKTGLKSIPGRLGTRGALWVAAGFHVIMMILLLAAFSIFRLSVLSWIGLGAVGIGLLYEHSLVKPDDLSRVNVAFFTVNGLISIVLLLFVGMDLCLHA